MTQRISEGRRTAYYVGIALMAIGGLMFASIFVTFAMNFDDIEAQAKSSMFRGIGGMVLLFLGGIIRGVGARGLAGSGVVLDPKQAREDLEPYSRMAGGMVKDALNEAGVSTGKPQPEKVIMIRCPGCSKLNEEGSKFCQECGGKL